MGHVHFAGSPRLLVTKAKLLEFRYVYVYTALYSTICSSYVSGGTLNWHNDLTWKNSSVPRKALPPQIIA